jgi:hypothetical protein
MMVEIRRLQPSIKIALPGGRVPDRGHTFTVVLRRRSEFPTPTPQPTPCVLWQGSVDRDGYGRMKRVRDGVRSTVAVHRWVMEEVLGRQLRRDEVILHACDNPPCFRIDHLSVGSLADNNADMRAKGRGVPPPINRYEGECHPMAKLSVHQVRAIRGHYQSGLTTKTIAGMFDVSVSTVQRIVAGIGWKHIPTLASTPPRSERTNRVKRYRYE